MGLVGFQVLRNRFHLADHRDKKLYSNGLKKNCPKIAVYRIANVEDDCSFNAIGSCHFGGGFVGMADGSVRKLAYDAGTSPLGNETLVEALASRSGREIINVEF